MGRIRGLGELDMFCAGAQKGLVDRPLEVGGTYHGRTHDERRMAVIDIFDLLY